MTAIVLRLVPAPGSVLLPDGLESLVRVLEPMGDELMFRVFTFDAVLKDTARTTYDEIQTIVDSSDRGLGLDWAGLVNFAEETYDVWDLLLAGFSRHALAPDRATFEELVSENEVAIEIFDSSYVRFSFKSDVLTQRALRTFPSAQRLTTNH